MKVICIYVCFGLGLTENFWPRPHTFWPRPHPSLASLTRLAAINMVQVRTTTAANGKNALHGNKQKLANIHGSVRRRFHKLQAYDFYKTLQTKRIKTLNHQHTKLTSQQRVGSMLRQVLYYTAETLTTIPG